MDPSGLHGGHKELRALLLCSPGPGSHKNGHKTSHYSELWDKLPKREVST